MNILVVGAWPFSLVNFRGTLLQAMQAAGHGVFAAANRRDPNTEEKLKELGVEYCPIRIARAGMNPLADLITLLDLIRLMRRVKPDVVLNYTIKPVIYGGWAARLCGVPVIHSLITGLGFAFKDESTLLHRLTGWTARIFYRLSLRRSRRVFFQNPDDARTFVDLGLVAEDRIVVVNGSGVDLMSFPFAVPRQPRSLDTPVRFLLVARLLRDKGIGEYAAAARLVKQKYPAAEFHLVGPFDPNPGGLKVDEIQAWERDGVILFHGHQANVRPFFLDCHVYVLPTRYGEGTPRTVLEAMATGRAIITTDAPGCRETVCIGDGEKKAETLKTGKNGILVPVKNPEALAAAMEFFIQNRDQIEIMGRESRRYAEERYDVHKVNEVMLREMGL